MPVSPYGESIYYSESIVNMFSLDSPVSPYGETGKITKNFFYYLATGNYEAELDGKVFTWLRILIEIRIGSVKFPVFYTSCNLFSLLKSITPLIA